MAYDEGMAELLREALAEEPTLTEKKMFGGLCFMVGGNMLCGVHKGGGMFRVGPEQFASALAVEGARPMDFTGRAMKGFVAIGYEDLGDDDARATLLDLARTFVASLPAKT